MRSSSSIAAGIAACALTATLALTGCSQASNSTTSNSASTNTAASSTQTATVTDRSGQRIDPSTISTTSEASSTADGEHAIEANGQTTSVTSTKVTKIGEADGDEADFYGENASVFATNGATLNVTDTVVTSNGKHANGIFSYGTGTTVNVSHTVIQTTGNCSGGLMTTGGGTMNADNVTAETTGNSSAAIRSDRGGGTVNVAGGYFTTAGTGSPVIYSTADITVSEAYLQSTSSQGVVIEGKNSVTLNDCQLIADNTSKSSNKSDSYQAVMIYQSMSGDASVGKSSFSMSSGSLENKNGDIFFVNNTSCSISLDGATIINNDADGLFLRAEAAGWGSEGSNGGKVNLNATSQIINGDMSVDSISTLNAYLTSGSMFTGAINSTGQTGNVYVSLDESSTWTLTADSYVSGLSCSDGAVNLNGHTLYVNGQAYTGGDSSGTAFDISSSSSGSGSGGKGGQGGSAPSKPDGEGGGSNTGNPGSGGKGSSSDGGTPPAKPDGDTSGSGNGGGAGGDTPTKPSA